MWSFDSALDEVISKGKRVGVSLDDMIADLESAVQGLKDEQDAE